MAAAKDKLLVAGETFACAVKGVEHIVWAGKVVPANHPAKAGRRCSTHTTRARVASRVQGLSIKGQRAPKGSLFARR
jgi:hypothetical protein